MGNLSNIIRNILWKKKEKRSSALRRQSEQTYKNNENRQEKKVERPSTTGRKNGEKESVRQIEIEKGTPADNRTVEENNEKIQLETDHCIGETTVSDTLEVAVGLAKEELRLQENGSELQEINPEVRYCDRYNIDSQLYDSFSIDDISMPNRLRSRLAIQGCKTIGQFLRLSPKDIKDIRGAGKSTVEAAEQTIREICGSNGLVGDGIQSSGRATGPLVDESEIRYCDRYNVDSELYDHVSVRDVNMPNRLRNLLARQGYLTIGQFLRLTTKEVASIQGAGKGTVQAAENVIREICSSRELGVAAAIKAEEQDIETMMSKIPSDRKEKLVVGYFQAFTDDNNIRERLLQFCQGNEVTVDNYYRAVINNNPDSQQMNLLCKFFAWLTFDLQDEIKQIGGLFLSDERVMKIAMMRANKETLQDIGEALAITRERVRQIEKKTRNQFIRDIHAHHIIKKIYAERNQDKVLTGAELSEYFGDRATVFLYFLRGSESADYEYDEDLDVFIVEDRNLIERVQEYMDTLPETIKQVDYKKIITFGIENYGLNDEIIDTAIKERYKLTGSIYHRSRLRLCDIYDLVLRKHYTDGIHVYDSEEMKNFREKIAEEYGEVNLPNEDRAIAAVIMRVGVLCNRGVYMPRRDSYISRELENQIRNYIDTSDASIFLMNTLFAEFQEELESYGITNKYYLQGVLKSIFGDKYYFRRDYLAKDDTVTSVYSDIIQFIKTSDYPVLKEEIYRRYPGITGIVVAIAVSDQEILNYYGQYLHASKLRVSNQEKEKIRNVLEMMTEKQGYVHGKDLFEGIIAVVEEFLTRNGIKSSYSLLSVVGYLFRDEYVIERPYIARNGVSIDRPEEILTEFILENDVVDISEINSIAQEQHYQINSILDFLNHYNDSHLLISKTQIARLEYIGLNAEIINLLEKLLQEEVTETRAIVSLESLAKLPQINIPWNEWLIYSIVNRDLERFDVKMSTNHFRNSIALIAPAGKMNISSMDISKHSSSNGNLVMADNLDDIDDLIIDAIEDEIDL